MRSYIDGFDGNIYANYWSRTLTNLFHFTLGCESHQPTANPISWFHLCWLWWFATPMSYNVNVIYLKVLRLFKHIVNKIQQVWISIKKYQGSRIDRQKHLHHGPWAVLRHESPLIRPGPNCSGPSTPVPSGPLTWTQHMATASNGFMVTNCAETKRLLTIQTSTAIALQLRNVLLLAWIVWKRAWPTILNKDYHNHSWFIITYIYGYLFICLYRHVNSIQYIHSR